MRESLGVNSVASLHAYATLKNAIRPYEFSTEFSGPLDEVAELFVDSILPDGGWIHLPDRPGFGLELDEKAVQRQKA